MEETLRKQLLNSNSQPPDEEKEQICWPFCYQIEALKDDLEELEEADLLLHVVDASDPRHAEQARAVETVLSSLDLEGTPRLLVFNKLDRDPDAARALAHREGGVAVSAATREGFPQLLARCEEILWRRGRVQAPGLEPEFVRPRQG